MMMMIIIIGRAHWRHFGPKGGVIPFTPFSSILVRLIFPSLSSVLIFPSFSFPSPTCSGPNRGTGPELPVWVLGKTTAEIDFDAF